ncbi:NAD(P)-binding protein [Lindgomyces ingoldianus]|uniref:NAD(P)-binding protein n=1 Tax=Lindgomyces ingoldianus TaxID=673940 RepID=A0ACB6QXS2_9PLEO|nr:NAD(P)-binding protein [Lindgomyces ingoldianus]KAF2471675.1 NAD(P)-binding protein [Lindgomyces ingoldianus]
MPIKNVALIGAAGTLGPSVLHALQSSPFEVFVLNRASSKSTYPNTSTITIPDDLNVPTLTTLFRSHAIDALVMTIAGSYVSEQKRLIEAAFNAGVQRVMPAEFGSCDSADEATNQLLPLMEGKKRVREFLQEVCGKEREEGMGKMTWTSLVTGHFFDYGMATRLMKFDVRARKAYLLDGGDVTFSASNLGFIGKAVVRVLERPKETENQLLYIHSHSTTQLAVLAILERLTGEKWERIQQDTKVLIPEARRRMLAGDKEATEEVVSPWGIVSSDWRGKEGFANGLLGLEEEDLESVLRDAVEGQK